MYTLLWIGIAFLIVALMGYFLGVNGVAGMSERMGRSLLGVFLVVAVVLIVASFFRGTTV